MWNLYTYSPSTGHIQLSGGVKFTLDSFSQFTLTCTSTGGPATTVTWTRPNSIVTEGTETVLDGPVTAQYTHTLGDGQEDIHVHWLMIFLRTQQSLVSKVRLSVVYATF